MRSASPVASPQPAASPSSPSSGQKKRPLRVGLIGAGKMAVNHAQAIARLGTGARVVAIADPSSSARSAVAAHAPGAAEHESIEQLLSAGGVDVIHVCTPPDTHRQLARAALEAGCHIYVEKPFTATVAEAEELLRVAASRDLLVCAGHQLLYEQPARKAETMAAALGRMIHLESYFSFRSGGGRLPADLQLLDILPHPVYLLLHFLERGSAGQTELVSVELGEAGTLHALVRRGSVTGHLIVTLEGRPVESYLRLVGTNGAIFADFVRGTVQHLFGPGTSGIDKILAPYRISAQLFRGTTSALFRRLAKRQRSYPGLAELFDAFYCAIRDGAASPVSPESIVETVRICEKIAAALAAQAPRGSTDRPALGRPLIAISGGTGFLGRAVVKALVRRGLGVRVLARRPPAAWERSPAVEYVAVDLGDRVDPEALAGSEILIHAAAETSGGWEEHQRNSIDATEQLFRAAAAAGVRRVIHVSSLAVLSWPRRGMISETTPLEPDSRGSGPYVWGKLESERRAVELGTTLGLSVKVVRPGAIVDYAAFDPPGRLGRRIGPLFVSVGGRRDHLDVVDLEFCADVLAQMAARFAEAPDVLNLLAPDLPTKRDLVKRLRRDNPGLTVIWLPWPVLVPLSGVASVLQKALRPSRPAISLRKVFASRRYDTAAVRALATKMGNSPESSISENDGSRETVRP